MRYEKEADIEKRIILIKSSTYDETGYQNVLECTSHFHEAKEFLFVTSGEQNICSNGDTYALSSSDIYFTDSFLPHLYQHSSAEGYVLLLRGYYLHFFHDMYGGQTLPNLLSNKEVNQKIISVVAEWYEAGIDDFLLNISYLYKIFSLIVSSYGVITRTQKKQDDIVQKMLEYVENNYRENIDLESMANYVNYSVVYCSKIWNKYVKESFRDYVNRHRIQKINTRISKKEKRETILEIAFEEGFDSQSTFYRAYRKVYGKTPKELIRPRENKGDK